jgi:hypothetical protein
MHVKEKICLAGLLLGTKHGCITISLYQNVLQCNGNIPVDFQPKSLSLRICLQLERLCLPCFGILREYCCPFSEVWWKCEFCIVLQSSVEALRCNLQKTSRPTGKMVTASYNARPHTALATQERIQELQWELLKHLPYSPELALSDFHVFGPLKEPLWWQTFHWWWRGCNRGAEGAETIVKRLLCYRFWHTGGTSVSMLVEDLLRNKRFFQVWISHVLRFISVCDLFTDSASCFHSKAHTRIVWNILWLSNRWLCGRHTGIQALHSLWRLLISL